MEFPSKQGRKTSSKRLSGLSACLMLSLVTLLFPIVYLVLSVLLPENIMDESCLWSILSHQDRRCFWPSEARRTVLLISMDGFRHDYLELVRRRRGSNALPNFRRLESNGVRANSSINVFPTVGLPNHQTLVTGLYPQHHGVVANAVVDSKMPDRQLKIHDQTSLNNDPWLVSWPEPIWVTLQKSGGLAGSILWPLTDSPVEKEVPFQQVPGFSLLNSALGHYSFDKRVSDNLRWLRSSRFHLDLIMTYFNEPDETGHAFGPESFRVIRVIEELDEHLGRLLDGLEKQNLNDQADIILTSDHGMDETGNWNMIGLDHYIHPLWYTYTQMSTFGFLYPVKEQFDLVYSRLKNAHPHLKVYRSEEVPNEFHLNAPSSRVPPLILIPDPTWYLVNNPATARLPAGDHGYTTSLSNMQPFFLARGPSFRSGHVVSEVHAVDVYPLMCALLQLEPKPNNGSFERISRILKPEVAYQLNHGIKVRAWIASNIRVFWLLCFVLLAISLTVGVLINEICRRRAPAKYKAVEDVSQL